MGFDRRGRKTKPGAISLLYFPVAIIRNTSIWRTVDRQHRHRACRRARLDLMTNNDCHVRSGSTLLQGCCRLFKGHGTRVRRDPERVSYKRGYFS